MPENNENPELRVMLSASDAIESIPVSLFNDGKLIAKTAATFNTNNKASLNFTLPQDTQIKGKLEIADSGLQYDNHLYFNLNKTKKIKVLAIGDENANFLKRIFTDAEFIFVNSAAKSLDYSLIAEQNLIILNQLPSIPTAMITNLKSFTDNGGKLVVIPSNSADLNSYNQFTKSNFGMSYLKKINDKRNITKINFSHPLYQNVFKKKVANFQYPMVSSYYTVKTNAASLLSYEDNEPFLVGRDQTYFFTASIIEANSNYKNSPLIVPTFYNMGKSSLQQPTLYTQMGKINTVDIVTKLAKDQILKAVKNGYEFIPQQRSFSNSVQLRFDENPIEDGIYTIKEEENSIQNISFNYPRKESQLSYINPNQLAQTQTSDSISAFFESFEKNSNINELWKWFVILALLFMLIEILIQKYL